MNRQQILDQLESNGTPSEVHSTNNARARRVTDRIPRRQPPTLNELVGQPNRRPWRRSNRTPVNALAPPPTTQEINPIGETPRSPSIIATEGPVSPRAENADTSMQPDNTPTRINSVFRDVLRHQLQHPDSDRQS